MLKGIIFDVDGTLLDSMHIWNELGVRYLTSIGVEPEEGLARILFPMSVEESSIYLKNHYGLSDPVEKIVKDTIALIDDFYHYEVTPKRGLLQYLEWIKSRGVPMVIATSGDREVLNKALARLGIADYFSGILTCSELRTSKREATIYLKAAELMGTLPEETVVFEDVLHGIRAAKSEGFITIGMEDPFSEQDRSEIIQVADYYIRDYMDPVLKTIS